MADKSFQKEMFELIKSMTGETNILATPKVFLDLTGDLETGTFLAQLVYLSDKGKRDDGFIYKTVDEWKNELYLSEYSVRKAKRTLEDIGLIETKVMKADGNPTVHYKVNKEALVESILRIRSLETSISQKPNFENKVSITETTTEITTYNPPIPQKGVDDSLQTKFKQFYSAYPNHKGKEKAWTSFKRIKPNDALFDMIMKAVSVQSKTEQWIKDNHKYVPMPATWLNGKRWEDETAPTDDTPTPNMPKDTWGGIKRI